MCGVVVQGYRSLSDTCTILPHSFLPVEYPNDAFCDLPPTHLVQWYHFWSLSLRPQQRSVVVYYVCLGGGVGSVVSYGVLVTYDRVSDSIWRARELVSEMPSSPMSVVWGWTPRTLYSPDVVCRNLLYRRFYIPSAASDAIAACWGDLPISTLLLWMLFPSNILVEVVSVAQLSLGKSARDWGFDELDSL